MLLKVCSRKSITSQVSILVSRTASARKVFGRNLRMRREALGVSQEALAHTANLHRTYIGSVERGERNVSIDNMERLAEAVDSTIAILLGS
jgi:transcriptional regulator with XRE-family HTH domain